jgi:hypothetical protein
LRFMKILSLAFLGLFLAVSSVSAQAASAPYYRFFRGVKRAELTEAQFLKALSEKFIPALPEIFGKIGLSGYLPVVPPLLKPAGFPDEIALVAYESEAVYQKIRATPQGIAYGNMHWQIFDKNLTQPGAAVALPANLAVLQSGVAYDVVNQPLDWQAGYTTFYIGTRKPVVPSAEFLPWLTHHVRQFSQSFARIGLRGYVMLGTEDYEIAFVNWDSKPAFDRAMSSPFGKPIFDEAGKYLDTRMFQGTTDFAGRAEPGQAYLVRF